MPHRIEAWRGRAVGGNMKLFFTCKVQKFEKNKNEWRQNPDEDFASVFFREQFRHITKDVLDW